MAGWIKLHRKMTDWEWFDDHNTFRLFMYLLMTVNHTAKGWQGITIPAGSIVTGRHKLSAETGLTERQVRTSLKRLKSTNEVTIKSSNKFSIISITNWHVYQESDQQNDQQVTSKRPASDQQVTTTKEGKNVKNDKKVLLDSDETPEKTAKPSGGRNTKDHNFDTWPEQPSHHVVDDFKKTRKARLTQTAIDRMAKEIWKAWEAGVHPDDCLAVCCEAGWQGFKFDWYVNREQRNEKNSRSGSGLTGASKRAADHHETLKRYAEGGASSVLDSEDF